VSIRKCSKESVVSITHDIKPSIKDRRVRVITCMSMGLFLCYGPIYKPGILRIGNYSYCFSNCSF